METYTRRKELVGVGKCSFEQICQRLELFRGMKCCLQCVIIRKTNPDHSLDSIKWDKTTSQAWKQD